MSTKKIMENKKNHRKTNSTYLVIAKGFKGEPVKLDAVKIEKNFITVAGRSGKTQIKLKVKYVYQYNEETYQKLRNAFDSNDSEALEQEWQKAKPIALS